MKKLYFLLTTLLITVSTTYGQVVINEIDADTPGTDMAEFIELKGTPNASLDGYVVVLYNGSNDLSYAAFDLDGKTLDANGFFILGNAGIISGSDIDLGASNSLQNGADAVAIYAGNDTDFPSGTAVTSANLIDALVYGTNDADDAELLAGLGETVQYNESANGASDSESLQLNAAGDAYETKVPTFRAENDAAVCELVLNTTSATCDTFTAGTDTYTATVDFTGGGTSMYMVSASSGTIDLSLGDPSTDAAGTITVTGISEGTDVTVTVQDGGLCDLSSMITTPSCAPTLSLPVYEDFDYADGSLTSNPNWTDFSGTTGDLLVSSGQAVVQHGTPSEDASIAFSPVSGDIYYAFDFTVVNPGSPITGGDYEYFALFKDDNFAFGARIDVVEANTPGNDFTVGISTSNSTADATWASDLSFDTVYRATVRYNQDTNIAELWINANNSTDTSILGTDEADPGIGITQFALRQSDSSLNEGILIDNLVISQTFNETLSTNTNSFNLDQVSIYPNPTNTGRVTISSSNNDAMNVQVFDVLGKQVKNETLTNNTLNVSDLNTGVYILKITQNNATTTKKLVIR
ncbi:MAG: hypothetical protein Tsb0033_12300 [Winogradskyella sp.]